MQTVEPIEAVEVSEYEQERGKPMPNYSHSMIELRLGAAFLAQGKGRYNVGAELTLQFDDGTILTPDIAVMPVRPVNWGLEPARCNEVPILVVEVNSPSQGYFEVMQKRDRYFAQGVESVWVVQPASQSIDIYRPNQQRPQIVQQGEAKDPATGLTVSLEDLFA